MSTSNDNTAPRGFLAWWLTPARPGLQRVIHPWEFRRLRFYGTARIIGGIIAAAAGIICLSYGVYPWAAFFLVIGALNLAGGCWYISIVRSAGTRT
jgi:hypothetical protein